LAPLAISIFGVHSQIISANPKGVVCKMQCLHCFVDFNHKKVEYQREFNAKKFI
jgi:wyosine [tRNA(Phe)-imidazoG37] synthetase (radical SAM superfamily)